MNQKSRLPDTDEPIEFEKYLVDVQDLCEDTDHCSGSKNRLSLRNNWLKFETSGRVIDHFRGIYRIYLDWMKAKSEDVNM